MRLSTYIENDLRYRIQSNDHLPTNLSLSSLANYYSVSVTPVRTAVDRLVKDKLVLKQSNNRLIINTGRIGTKKLSNPPITEFPRSPDYWDEILLREVMLASLRREPVYLREEMLSQKHQVGRSIIRQSFSRFAGSHFIAHIPRRGWLVEPFNQEDLHAYLEIREVLELKALELARPNLDKSELTKLIQRTPSKPGIRRTDLDHRIHEYIIEKSGNCYIRNFFRQYNAKYYTALTHYAAPKTAVVNEMTAQHQAILNALLSKAWARARHELRNHIRAQESVLSKLLTMKTLAPHVR